MSSLRGSVIFSFFFSFLLPFQFLFLFSITIIFAMDNRSHVTKHTSPDLGSLSVVLLNIHFYQTI